MPHRPKLLALPACFALACSLYPDLSSLDGADASSEAASPDASTTDSAPPDSSASDSASDSAVKDAGFDANGGADADGSSAVVSNVQIGPLAFVANGGSVAPTLATPSGNGTLLVATVTSDSTAATVGAPSGWTLAISGTGFANGSSIWYANKSGVSSATFTSSNGGALAAQISEWSGVTKVDQTGTTSTASATTSVSVSTSGALTAGGELAITAYGQATGQQSLITYTPGAGWTSLGATGTTRLHYTADYRIGVGPGALNETMTSSAAATWVAVIASFK